MSEKVEGPVLTSADQLICFVTQKFEDEIGTELAGGPLALLCNKVQNALVREFANVKKGPEVSSVKLTLNDETRILTFCQSLARGYLYKRLCWSFA